MSVSTLPVPSTQTRTIDEADGGLRNAITMYAFPSGAIEVDSSILPPNATIRDSADPSSGIGSRTALALAVCSV